MSTIGILCSPHLLGGQYTPSDGSSSYGALGLTVSSLVDGVPPAAGAGLNLSVSDRNLLKTWKWGTVRNLLLGIVTYDQVGQKFPATVALVSAPVLQLPANGLDQAMKNALLGDLEVWTETEFFAVAAVQNPGRLFHDLGTAPMTSLGSMNPEGSWVFLWENLVQLPAPFGFAANLAYVASCRAQNLSTHLVLFPELQDFPPANLQATLSADGISYELVASNAGGSTTARMICPATPVAGAIAGVVGAEQFFDQPSGTGTFTGDPLRELVTDLGRLGDPMNCVSVISQELVDNKNSFSDAEREHLCKLIGKASKKAFAEINHNLGRMVSNRYVDWPIHSFAPINPVIDRVYELIAGKNLDAQFEAFFARLWARSAADPDVPSLGAGETDLEVAQKYFLLVSGAKIKGPAGTYESVADFIRDEWSASVTAQEADIKDSVSAILNSLKSNIVHQALVQERICGAYFWKLTSAPNLAAGNDGVWRDVVKGLKGGGQHFLSDLKAAALAVLSSYLGKIWDLGAEQSPTGDMIAAEKAVESRIAGYLLDAISAWGSSYNDVGGLADCSRQLVSSGISVQLGNPKIDQSPSSPDGFHIDQVLSGIGILVKRIRSGGIELPWQLGTPEIVDWGWFDGSKWASKTFLDIDNTVPGRRAEAGPVGTIRVSESGGLRNMVAVYDGLPMTKANFERVAGDGKNVADISNPKPDDENPWDRFGGRRRRMNAGGVASDSWDWSQEPLVFSDLYQFAAFPVTTAGILPPGIANPDHPSQLSRTPVHWKVPKSAVTQRWFLRQAVFSSPKIIADVSRSGVHDSLKKVPWAGVDFNSSSCMGNLGLYIPAIPEDVYPLSRELSRFDLENGDTDVSRSDMAPVLVSAASKSFSFSLLPPTTDIKTWEYWMRSKPGDMALAVAAGLASEEKRRLKARGNLQDAIRIDDPAVEYLVFAVQDGLAPMKGLEEAVGQKFCAVPLVRIDQPENDPHGNPLWQGDGLATWWWKPVHVKVDYAPYHGDGKVPGFGVPDITVDTDGVVHVSVPEGSVARVSIAGGVKPELFANDASTIQPLPVRIIPSEFLLPANGVLVGDKKSGILANSDLRRDGLDQGLFIGPETIMTFEAVTAEMPDIAAIYNAISLEQAADGEVVEVYGKFDFVPGDGKPDSAFLAAYVKEVNLDHQEFRWNGRLLQFGARKADLPICLPDKSPANLYLEGGAGLQLSDQDHKDLLASDEKWFGDRADADSLASRKPLSWNIVGKPTTKERRSFYTATPLLRGPDKVQASRKYQYHRFRLRAFSRYGSLVGGKSIVGYPADRSGKADSFGWKRAILFSNPTLDPQKIPTPKVRLILPLMERFKPPKEEKDIANPNPISGASTLLVVLDNVGYDAVGLAHQVECKVEVIKLNTGIGGQPIDHMFAQYGRDPLDMDADDWSVANMSADMWKGKDTTLADRVPGILVGPIGHSFEKLLNSPKIANSSYLLDLMNGSSGPVNPRPGDLIKVRFKASFRKGSSVTNGGGDLFASDETDPYWIQIPVDESQFICLSAKNKVVSADWISIGDGSKDDPVSVVAALDDRTKALHVVKDDGSLVRVVGAIKWRSPSLPLVKNASWDANGRISRGVIGVVTELVSDALGNRSNESFVGFVNYQKELTSIIDADPVDEGFSSLNFIPIAFSNENVPVLPTMSPDRIERYRFRLARVEMVRTTLTDLTVIQEDTSWVGELKVLWESMFALSKVEDSGRVSMAYGDVDAKLRITGLSAAMPIISASKK